MYLILIIIGIILLYIGGEAIIRGSVALSLKNNIPPMIVGLTVVGFGTSLPELIVSVQSALEGYGNLAVGNAIGSNIANILLVLAAGVLISPVIAKKSEAWRDWIYMMLATLLLLPMFFMDEFGFMQGAILLLFFAYVMQCQFRRAFATGELPEEVDLSAKNMPNSRIILALIIGIIALALGADLLVEGAVGLARMFGVSEAIIGLTIVAIGTSLPELVTTISAARKGESAMILGNVIGSNIFNIALILGVTGLISEFEIERYSMLMSLGLLIPLLLYLGYVIYFEKPMGRKTALALIMLYILYLLALVR